MQIMMSMSPFGGRQIFSFSQDMNGVTGLRVMDWCHPELGLRLELCPWTIGGDRFDLCRPYKLTSDHYNQTNSSKNHELWSEHHWDLLGRTNEFSDMNGPTVERKRWDKKVDIGVEERLLKVNAADYTTAHPLHERLRMARDILTLEFILDTLKMHGFPEGYKTQDDCIGDAHLWRKLTEENMTTKLVGPKPVLPDNYGADFVHPRIRKANNTVEPVKALVKRVKGKKKIVTTVLLNAGNPIQAVREYAKLIMELYPWTASPLFFSNNDAFLTGIAQLTSDLWVHLGIAALHALRLTNHFRFATAARDCGDAILNMRYTTRTAMSKASFIHHEAYAWKNEKEPMRIQHVPNLLLHDAVRSVSGYIVGQTFRQTDKKDGAWAHKKCYTEHVCHENQWEGYEVMLKKLHGDQAVYFPHGTDRPPLVHTDFSVNDKAS